MLQGKCIHLNIKKSNSSRVTCVVFLQLFLFHLNPNFILLTNKSIGIFHEKVHLHGEGPVALLVEDY